MCSRALGLAALALVLPAGRADALAFFNVEAEMSVTAPGPITNALGYAGPFVLQDEESGTSGTPEGIDAGNADAAGGFATYGFPPAPVLSEEVIFDEDPYPGFPDEGTTGVRNTAESRATGFAEAPAPGTAVAVRAEARTEFRYRFLNITGTPESGLPAQNIAVSLAVSVTCDYEVSVIGPGPRQERAEAGCSAGWFGPGAGEELFSFEESQEGEGSKTGGVASGVLPVNFVARPGELAIIQIFSTARGYAESIWPPSAPPPDIPGLPPVERVPLPGALGLLLGAAAGLAGLGARRRAAQK